MVIEKMLLSRPSIHITYEYNSTGKDPPANKKGDKRLVNKVGGVDEGLMLLYCKNDHLNNL